MTQELTVYFTRAQLVTANRLGHWRTRAKKVRHLRDTTHVWARACLKPPGERCRIVMTYGWTGPGRVRDAGNLQPTSKACVDGLVDAGIFPDDNDKYVEGPDNRFGEKSDRDGLVKITIRLEAA